MKEKFSLYLIYALVIGIMFHGAMMFYTLENSYDALIHLFFAEHYASNWFEVWNYKWYTGFTVLGYPPLVHQSIALFSFIGGLKFGLFLVTLITILLFITGIYKYSYLITKNKDIAGITALVAVFSSTFIETLHIFGQLPSLVGIALLLHALPDLYKYIRNGASIHLIKSLSLLAVTTTSHHVTTIFGMIFFILPLIGMAIIDYSKGQVGSYKEVTILLFFKSFKKLFKRISYFSIAIIILIVICILPYWINTKENPITQVPIPHGSRDNFLEVISSGLVFFIVPWGIILFFIPYIFYRFFSKRFIFFGISLSVLTLLGTGSTTPIPKLILGETAFNILTLDRFTLWATIMSFPIFGEFIYRFTLGDIKQYLVKKFGHLYYRITQWTLLIVTLASIIFSSTVSYFSPLQPQKLKMLPIVNFLHQDQHEQWRFLTLGFGDQMAWLSAQTNALTVDGDYHSARRLPELTSRAIERLENSKYRGTEGIGSLQQFLTNPEKYHLKYIFSNDNFYDPLLYFSGWQYLQQLENGVRVWEKMNVPTLSTILPKEDTHIVFKLMWGIIPFLTVLIALTIFLTTFFQKKNGTILTKEKTRLSLNYSTNYLWLTHGWAWLLGITAIVGLYYLLIYNSHQKTISKVITAYYDALDYRELERAYSYLDPESNLSQEQFMLEYTVSSGMLSSYAKLNSIKHNILKKSESSARVKVTVEWITSLKTITKEFIHDFKRINGKWYIEPLTFEQDIPPDQLFTDNTTQFYNHGRRHISAVQTHHEDILKQPVLEILSAKLVKRNENYSIIGELQNIDNTPADVVIEATLYSEDDEVLAKYNAGCNIKHKILPKETTSFRIDFESIAWLDSNELAPENFNPNEFSPIRFTDKLPVKFSLKATGNVATSGLYKKVSLADINFNKNNFAGTLFNYGIKEVIVPQILVSYYNENQELLWVDSNFITEGVRVQRKQYFNINYHNLDSVILINDTMEDCFVNGLPNNEITHKLLPDRDYGHKKQLLQPINKNNNFSFIKIEINNYTGLPK